MLSSEKPLPQPEEVSPDFGQSFLWDGNSLLALGLHDKGKERNLDVLTNLARHLLTRTMSQN